MDFVDLTHDEEEEGLPLEEVINLLGTSDSDAEQQERPRKRQRTDVGPQCGGASRPQAAQREATPPAEAPKQSCPICLEDIEPVFQHTLAACKHPFCLECLRGYVAGKVADRAGFPIACPLPGCGAPISVPECGLVLTPEELDALGKMEAESAIPAPHRLYCPIPTCSQLLLLEGEPPRDTEMQCPHCSGAICASCRVPWHAGLTCQEFKELPENLGEEDLTMLALARKKRWRQCPKCRNMVERSSGCNAMRCRCGAAFCYQCGRDLPQCHCAATRGHMALPQATGSGRPYLPHGYHHHHHHHAEVGPIFQMFRGLGGLFGGLGALFGMPPAAGPAGGPPQHAAAPLAGFGMGGGRAPAQQRQPRQGRERAAAVPPPPPAAVLAAQEAARARRRARLEQRRAEAAAARFAGGAAGASAAAAPAGAAAAALGAEWEGLEQVASQQPRPRPHPRPRNRHAWWLGEGEQPWEGGIAAPAAAPAAAAAAAAGASAPREAAPAAQQGTAAASGQQQQQQAGAGVQQGNGGALAAGRGELYRELLEEALERGGGRPEWARRRQRRGQQPQQAQQAQAEAQAARADAQESAGGEAEGAATQAARAEAGAGVRARARALYEAMGRGGGSWEGRRADDSEEEGSEVQWWDV